MTDEALEARMLMWVIIGLGSIVAFSLFMIFMVDAILEMMR